MRSKWKYSLFLALAYIVTGYIGLTLPMFGTSITLIWLPTGISVGMLFRYGYGCWPGVAIGALITNLANGSPFVVALGIACGNTLGPITATYLLHRLLFERTFERQREIFLLSIAAAIGMTITATLGVFTLSLVGQIQQDYVHAWFTWWAGDTMGIISAAPMMMVLNRKEVRFLANRRIEFISWLLTLVLLCLVVFVWNSSETKTGQVLALLPLPMMVWAAMRFGATGTSIGVILLTFGASIGIAKASGPFKGTTTAESVFLLLMYMLTCVVIGWLVRILDTNQRKTATFRKLLERAMNDASLGVLLSDRDRKIVYANDGFERLTGYRRSEIVGKSCSVLQGPETNPETIKEIKLALHRQGNFWGEILNYRKDGTTFWNSLSISPVHDELGEINGFLGVQLNISQRKMMQISLQESELRFRTLTNHAPVGIFTTDEQGYCTFVNSRWSAIVGLSIEEAKGQGWSKVLHPEDRKRVLQEWHASVETEKDFVSDFRFVNHGVGMSWVHGTATPLRDECGHVTGYVGTITDLTELFHAKEVLQRLEEQQRLALDAAALGTWKFELNSQWVQLDEQSRRIFGLKQPLMSRDYGVNQIHPEDRERVKSEFSAAYDPTGSRNIASEYRIVLETGEIRWVSVRARYYFSEDSSDSSPDHVIGAVQDITESRNSEELIRDSLLEKEAMLREIHHRVKNNLQIVTSLLNLQAVGNLSQDSINILQESKNRVRAMALVHEILYGSSNLGQINLASYIDQLCGQLFRAYGIDFSIIHLDLQIADVSLNLERAIPFGLIVNELVSNSLKYAFPNHRKGSILLQVQITADDWFSLTVADDGIGLPNNFDIKQLKSLGLQLVFDLALQLSGSISFSGMNGTEFRLNFPVNESS